MVKITTLCCFEGERENFYTLVLDQYNEYRQIFSYVSVVIMTIVHCLHETPTTQLDKLGGKGKRE